MWINQTLYTNYIYNKFYIDNVDLLKLNEFSGIFCHKYQKLFESKNNKKTRNNYKSLRCNYIIIINVNNITDILLKLY